MPHLQDLSLLPLAGKRASWRRLGPSPIIACKARPWVLGLPGQTTKTSDILRAGSHFGGEQARRNVTVDADSPSQLKRVDGEGVRRSEPLQAGLAAVPPPPRGLDAANRRDACTSVNQGPPSSQAMNAGLGR